MRRSSVKVLSFTLRMGERSVCGVRNAGCFLGGARRPAAIIKHGDDLRRQNRLTLLKIGVGQAKVAEYIAAAAHQFPEASCSCHARLTQERHAQGCAV